MDAVAPVGVTLIFYVDENSQSTPGPRCSEPPPSPPLHLYPSRRRRHRHRHRFISIHHAAAAARCSPPP